MEDNQQKIIVIGLGQMGSAIAKMLLQSGYTVIGADISPEAEKNMGNYASRMEIFSNTANALETEAPVILAVKPDQIEETIGQINDNRLVISIAAGITLASLEKWRKKKGPIVRAMPNVPLQVRHGVIAFCMNSVCSDEDKEFVHEAFEKGGESVFLDDEKYMHAVTGISGSGPAFVFLFIQSLEDAGVLEGLPRSLARELAVQTVLGSAEMARRHNGPSQDLIHDVTSPGGTTIVGVKVLKQQRLEHAVQEAVLHSSRRSRELGS